MRKWILTFMIAALAGNPALAADWYIDWNNGNNTTGNGSFTNPWKSFDKALRSSLVNPGDTIWARAGTYIEQINLSSWSSYGQARNGTPDSLITVRAYENGGVVEEVILQGGIQSAAQSAGVNYGVNLRLMNLRITGSNKHGYFLTGDNTGNITELIGMEIDNNAWCGVLFGWQNHNAGTVRLTNCYIHHNNGASTEGNCGITFNCMGRLEIDSCEVSYNGDINRTSSENKGINMRNQVGLSGFLKNSHIHHNIETGIDYCIENGEISGNIIHDNGLLDTEASEIGDNNLTLQSYSHDNLIHHNLIYNSGRYGLHVISSNNIIYNNTVVDMEPYLSLPIPSSYDRAAFYIQAHRTGNIIKNNLFVNLIPYQTGDDYDTFLACLCSEEGGDNGYEDNTYDYNCYYAPNHPQGKYMKISGETSYTLQEILVAYPPSIWGNDENSMQQDPQMLDPAGFNFYLNMNSPCRNAGTTDISGTVIIPPSAYSGSAPDIGYWEDWGENTPPWIDPPVPDFVTDEDLVFTYNLSPHENDQQQAGTELTWTFIDLNPALANAEIDPVTDLITITPLSNQYGSDAFTLLLSDGQGGQDAQEVNLTVNPLNDPPLIEPSVPDQSTEEDIPLSFDLTPYEHDLEQSSTELIWTVSGLDPALASAIVNPTTDVLTITPELNKNGSDIFTLILSDGEGGFDSQNLTLYVTPVNDPPDINPQVPEGNAKEDITFHFDLTPFETDIEDSTEALYWTVSGANPSLMTASVDPITDMLTLVPVENNWGLDTLRLKLHDSGGLTDSSDWIVTVWAVNDTPWISPPVPNQVFSSYDPISVPLQPYGHDVEDPPEELNWEISGVDPELFSVTINPNDQVMTIVPVPGLFGTDEALLTLRDTEGGNISQDITFFLLGTGAPPIGPQISNLPDLEQPIGSIPDPLDLSLYVACGTIPFGQLQFLTTIWNPDTLSGGYPELIVSVQEGYLTIQAPTPDWQGVNMIAVRVEDIYGYFSQDTMMVTFAYTVMGELIEPIGPEVWGIVESSQTVHADQFNLHITIISLPENFVSFQMKGGQITDWQDASGVEEFAFPLISNAQNTLSLRIRYDNQQYGTAKSVAITEDSAPPAPPSGLSYQ